MISEFASVLQRNDILYAVVIMVGTAIGVKLADLMVKKMINLAKQKKINLDELILKSFRIPILVGLIIIGIG